MRASVFNKFVVLSLALSVAAVVWSATLPVTPTESATSAGADCDDHRRRATEVDADTAAADDDEDRPGRAAADREFVAALALAAPSPRRVPCRATMGGRRATASTWVRPCVRA